MQRVRYINLNVLCLFCVLYGSVALLETDPAILDLLQSKDICKPTAFDAIVFIITSFEKFTRSKEICHRLMKSRSTLFAQGLMKEI